MSAALCTPSLGARGALAGRRLPGVDSAAAPQRPRVPRRQRLSVAASLPPAPKPPKRSEADLYQVAVAAPLPPPPPPARSGLAGQPWYVTAPLAFVGLVATLRAVKFIRKKLGGSNRLEERGFKRGGVSDDRAYSRAIKGMKRMDFEELSEEQILAARRRRQREVEKDMAPLDLDKIELPENHPFAVKKQLGADEEALQRSRFSARRGLSAEDMQRLREQQALADQMDAEEEARQAARRRQG